MYGVSSQIDEKFESFAEKLPHGSGIDADWNAHESTNYVYFTNSYHQMDQQGGYTSWQDFSVRLPKTAWENGDYSDVKIEFNNGQTYQTRLDPFGWRDMIWQIVYWSLNE